MRNNAGEMYCAQYIIISRFILNEFDQSNE